MKVYKSIRAKFFLINAAMILIVDAAITGVFWTFANIEELMSTLSKRDVDLMLANARIGRERSEALLT